MVKISVLSQTDKTPLIGSFIISGGQGGTRTLTAFGQRILSPQRLPIPPLARLFILV